MHRTGILLARNRFDLFFSSRDTDLFRQEAAGIALELSEAMRAAEIVGFAFVIKTAELTLSVG